MQLPPREESPEQSSPCKQVSKKEQNEQTDDEKQLILQELREIKAILVEVKQSCKKMDSHIGFVERCLRPFDFVSNACARLR